MKPAVSSGSTTPASGLIPAALRMCSRVPPQAAIAFRWPNASRKKSIAAASFASFFASSIDSTLATASKSSDGVPSSFPSMRRRLPSESARCSFGPTSLTCAPAFSAALRSAVTCARSLPSDTRMPIARPCRVSLALSRIDRAGEGGRSIGSRAGGMRAGSGMPRPSAARCANCSSTLRACASVRTMTCSFSTLASSNTSAETRCARSMSVRLFQNMRGWLKWSANSSARIRCLPSPSEAARKLRKPDAVSRAVVSPGCESELGS